MTRFVTRSKPSDCGLIFGDDEEDILTCYWCNEEIDPNENYKGHVEHLKCERCVSLEDEIKNGESEVEDE
ncbi:MAG: hypothetical protein WC748_09825 [Legionellales bacterium]|jgi:hypothetical protein